jgi:hypothetical protein
MPNPFLKIESGGFNKLVAWLLLVNRQRGRQ